MAEEIAGTKYLVCCRDGCLCSLKHENYDVETMKLLKGEFDKETVELFGG
jgi:hypothetical protein